MSSPRGQTVVITGATGFVGQNLLPVLLRAGHTVRAVARKIPTKNTPRVRWVKADLMKDISPSVFKGVSTVFHLAGRIDINGANLHPKERILENVSMTLNLLESIRISKERPLVVFSSTDRMYGRAIGTVDESTAPYHIEPYTTSKILAEDLLRMYGALYGIPYVILRVDSIYGPHQPAGMFISDVIMKINRGGRVETGNLSTKKNFVFVGDVVHAMMCAMKAGEKAKDQTYNIGGVSVSLRDVVDILAKRYKHISGRSVEIAEGGASSRSKSIEVRPFHLSVRKAKRMLGWYPKTPLSKGLEYTLRYFQA